MPIKKAEHCFIINNLYFLTKTLYKLINYSWNNTYKYIIHLLDINYYYNITLKKKTIYMLGHLYLKIKPIK